MGILGKLISPIYVGIANGRFLQRQYNIALKYYEKALKIDNSNSENKYLLSCLGRCYLLLGNYERSLEYLSVSYDLYNKNIRAICGDFERREFIELLKAYANASHLNGHLEKANELALKIEELESSTGATL